MQPNDPQDDVKAACRTLKDGPWFWQSKAAMKKIRDNCGKFAPTAFALYGALAEIASDRGSERFDVTHLDLMKKAGIRSDRTVRNRLEDLERLGIIHVIENRINERLRGPSTYSLCPVIITDRSVNKKRLPLPGEEKNSKNSKNMIRDLPDSRIHYGLSKRHDHF